MKETIKDFFGYFKPIFENTQYRFNNPLGYAFAFSWILFNWKAVYYFFFSDEKAADKIVYLQNMYKADDGTSFTFLLVLPLCSSALYIILAPIISNLATMIWAFFDKSCTSVRLWFVENIPFMSRAEQTEMYNTRVKNETVLRNEIKRRDEMISILYSSKALNDIADRDAAGKYKPSLYRNENFEQEEVKQELDEQQDLKIESDISSESDVSHVDSVDLVKSISGGKIIKEPSTLSPFSFNGSELANEITVRKNISLSKSHSIIKKLNNIFDDIKVAEIFDTWFKNNSSHLIGLTDGDEHILRHIWKLLMNGGGIARVVLREDLKNESYHRVIANMTHAGFIVVNKDQLYFTDKMVDSIVSATEGFM